MFIRPTLHYGGGGAGFSTLVAQDLFAEPTLDTALDAHTMDLDPGGGWTVTSISSWWLVEAASDWLYFNNSNTVYHYAYVDASAANCRVVLDLTTDDISTGSYKEFGIVLRWVDANNYWMLYLDNSQDEIGIAEFNAGTRTNRASTAVAIANSTKYRLEAIADGSDLSLTIDGGNEITYSSSLHASATKHGIHVYYNLPMSDHCTSDLFEIYT